jgi:hypothetical protein
LLAAVTAEKDNWFKEAREQHEKRLALEVAKLT